MRALIVVLLLALALPHAAAATVETLEIEAADGLPVTIDLDRPAESARTAIVLFHQASSSRGEYRTIAPRLADLGYLALAVDQRAGSDFDGVLNRTASRAAQQAVATGFLDARPDLEAALRYARNELGAATVVGWGSSYSASLVLMIAGESDLADGVLAFSPGEYFGSTDLVAQAAATIEVPVFLTSAAFEGGQWAGIQDAVPDATTFLPETGRGAHGSSALLPDRSDAADAYWAAVEAFLLTHFPP